MALPVSARTIKKLFNGKPYLLFPSTYLAVCVKDAAVLHDTGSSAVLNLLLSLPLSPVCSRGPVGELREAARLCPGQAVPDAVVLLHRQALPGL